MRLESRSISNRFFFIAIAIAFILSFNSIFSYLALDGRVRSLKNDSVLGVTSLLDLARVLYHSSGGQVPTGSQMNSELIIRLRFR